MRILLADRQSLFREAVRVVLERESDLEVVAEAGDGFWAVAETERVHPDVALVDAALADCDGFRATEMIRERSPRCQVVIVSSTEDADVLQRALEAGARGFISRGAPLIDLLEVARAVNRGDTVVPQRMMGELLGRLLQRRREQNDALLRISRLTRREREVLGLLAGGAGTEAIARVLVISRQTARTHIQNILAKLRVHSRLEAAALANEADLVAGLDGGPFDVVSVDAVSRPI